MNTLLRAFLVLLANLIAASCWVAHGAERPAEEAMYRCKGPDGKLRVGSDQPAECVGRDTEVLSKSGTVIRVIEAQGTREKRLEQEAVTQQTQKAKEEKALRDRVLLDTYISVGDIERRRDQRLDLLDAQLKITEQHLSTLKDRIARLRDDTARFSPYSSKPNSPPLPDHLAEEIVNTIKSMATDQQTIDIKRDEQQTMTVKFEQDIKRFKELKGIK